MSLSWPEASAVLKWDGGLWHICVLRTGADDWHSVIRALRGSRLEWKYTVDYKTSELGNISDVFALKGEHLPRISVTIAGIIFYSRFIQLEEIVFDADPRDIHDQSSLDCVSEFMVFLGDATKKDVQLTPDGMHDDPFVTYITSCNRFEYHCPA